MRSKIIALSKNDEKNKLLFLILFRPSLFSFMISKLEKSVKEKWLNKNHKKVISETK